MTYFDPEEEAFEAGRREGRRSVMARLKSLSLDGLQLEITEWQRQTFPKADVVSVSLHLVKEAREVEVEAAWFFHYLEKADAVRLDQTRDSLAEELADVVHLVFGVASLAGVDLAQAVAKKFEKNKNRKWKEPDANGIVEHVKDWQRLKP